MEAYKDWVRANRHIVSSIENFAHTMTWLLPERFSASEIGPEAVTALVGLITALNQHIIESPLRPFRHVGSGPQEPGFPWSLCISGVKEIEVLIEVAAEHYLGKDKKWSYVAATEAVKAFLRLILLHKNGYKMLIDGGVTKSVQDASGPPEAQSVGSIGPPEGWSMTSSQMIPPGGPSGYPRGRRFEGFPGYNPQKMEDRALQALRKFGENFKTSHPSWLTREPEYPERTLQPTPSPSKSTLVSLWQEKGLPGGCFVLGEMIVILRPFIYALLIRRYGLRSWKSWLLSLAMDLAGMSIISSITSPDSVRRGRAYSLSRLEREEVKRRKLLLALYIMRDPLFSKHIRHRLEYFEQLLKPVPVIGTLTAKAVELIQDQDSGIHQAIIEDFESRALTWTFAKRLQLNINFI